MHANTMHIHQAHTPCAHTMRTLTHTCTHSRRHTIVSNTHYACICTEHTRTHTRAHTFFSLFICTKNINIFYSSDSSLVEAATLHIFYWVYAVNLRDDTSSLNACSLPQPPVLMISVGINVFLMCMYVWRVRLCMSVCVGARVCLYV